jgi:hypothetical protein
METNLRRERSWWLESAICWTSVVEKSRGTTRSSWLSTIPSLHGQNPILLPSVVLPSKDPVWCFDRPQSDRVKLPVVDRPRSDRANTFRAKPHYAWARVNGLKASSSFHGAREKSKENELRDSFCLSIWISKRLKKKLNVDVQRDNGSWTGEGKGFVLMMCDTWQWLDAQITFENFQKGRKIDHWNDV